jgi:hypothetical protein
MGKASVRVGTEGGIGSGRRRKPPVVLISGDEQHLALSNLAFEGRSA